MSAVLKTMKIFQKHVKTLTSKSEYGNIFHNSLTLFGNPTICTEDEELYVCGNHNNSESVFLCLDLNISKNLNSLAIILDICLSGNITV